MRITEKDLIATCNRINEAAKAPLESYSKRGGTYSANVGNYYIDYACGGASLHRMESEGGSVSDVFRCGHITKRDLYERMHAFLTGLTLGD